MDLALNNQQWLMCHKTKANQTLWYGDTVDIFYSPSPTGLPLIKQLLKSVLIAQHVQLFYKITQNYHKIGMLTGNYFVLP